MNNRFLNGKILPSLIIFAIPLMLSLFLQALYGAADLFVVGQFGSPESISAVATGSQVMVAVTAIVTGLTMGVTVLIGQAIGLNDNQKAGITVCGMIKLFTLVSLILTVILIIFAPFIVKIMSVPVAAKTQTANYIRICGSGMIFITLYNAISGIFRGIGNSKTPFLFIAIACIINIILDFIFVGFFNMDAAGAALATIIAQACSVLFSLLYLKKHKLPFKIKKSYFKNKGNVKNILIVGAPLALQDFLVSISFLIITSIINNLGLTESASIGIAEKLFVFLSIVPMSFLSTLATFVAQNIGNNNLKRANQALFIASALSFCFGTAVFLLTFFKGDFLASIFSKDTAIINATALYFKSCSFEYLIISLSFCMLGYFNGLKKTIFVMAQGLITAFFIRIPLSYYLSKLPNTSMLKIGLAVPLSAAVSLILCIIYFIVLKLKLKKDKNLYNYL